MSVDLGKIGRPHTHISLFGLMDCHIWWPHSIVDNSLSKVPLLEEISSIFLMGWMDLWEKDHLVHQLSLLESLINDQIVLLMHSTVATLT